MKVSKAKAAEHRAALVDAALRLFQERGFDGAGVEEISRAAGLTQGAFYAHFPSKADLAIEACRKSYADGVTVWKAVRGTTRSDLGAYLDVYVSPVHREDVALGCPMAAYAGEMRRRPRAVQEVFTQGFEEMVDLMQAALPGRRSRASRRKALLLISAMSGSVAMARAVQDTAPEMSREILIAAREGLEAFAMSDGAGLPDFAPARTKAVRAARGRTA